MQRLRSWLSTQSTARDVWFLTLVVAVLYLLTGDHPALGSANRYTEACREMVELRQWAVPHLGYVPYLEKPILMYWLGAATQWLFGSGNLASNLPAGLAGLVTVLATYALGSRLRGPLFGLHAGLLLLTSAFFLSMVSTLTTDPILAACLAVGWWTWWRWQESRDSGTAGGHWIWGFWAALGCAFLTKGPVAIVVAGAAIGGYAFLTGGLRGVVTTWWAMCPLRGLLVLAAINLPWTLVIWQRDPRLLEFFYVYINFQAFFDGSHNHPGPWWYYGPILAGFLAPYTLLALPALVVGCWQALAPAVRRFSALSGWLGEASTTPLPAAIRARLFLACVVLFPLIFFSLSASKLGTYPMPLLPAIVVLVMDAWWDWEAGGRRWWVWVIVAAIAIFMLALACAPWVVIAIEEVSEQPQPLTIGLLGLHWVIGNHSDPGLAGVNWALLPLALLAIAVLAGGLLWSCIVAVQGRLLQAMAMLGAAFTLVVILILPRIDDLIIDLDGARLMTVVKTQGGTDDLVILHQEVVHDYELVHTLGRRTAILGNARELGIGHLSESTPPSVPFPPDPYETNGETLPANRWLYSHVRLHEEWGGQRRLWLVCDQSLIRELEKSGLTIHRIDHYRKTWLVSNRP